MELFKNANSYATRKNAINKLKSVLRADMDSYFWMITTNEAGRFLPVVKLEGEQTMDMATFAHQGICVC